MDVFDSEFGVEMDDIKIDTQNGAITLQNGLVLIDSATMDISSLLQLRKHESVHVARQTLPELYNAISSAVEDIGIQINTNSDVFEVIANKYEQIHPGKTADTEKIIEETLAQIAGWHNADPEFARKKFGSLFNDYDAVIAVLAELDAAMKRAAE